MALDQLAFIFTLLLHAAYGYTTQPTAQASPEARAAVRGNCIVSLAVGQSVSPGSTCNIETLDSAALGSVVPPGKILIIEDASASCGRASADIPATLGISRLIVNPGSPPGHVVLGVIPLLSHGTENGVVRVSGFTSGRSYYAQSNRLGAVLTLAAPATKAVNCCHSPHRPASGGPVMQVQDGSVPPGFPCILQRVLQA